MEDKCLKEEALEKVSGGQYITYICPKCGTQLQRERYFHVEDQ